MLSLRELVEIGVDSVAVRGELRRPTELDARLPPAPLVTEGLRLREDAYQPGAKPGHEGRPHRDVAFEVALQRVAVGQIVVSSDAAIRAIDEDADLLAVRLARVNHDLVGRHAADEPIDDEVA